MKGAFQIVIVCSFLSLGMGSCSPTIEEACRTQLPALQQDLSQASHQIIHEIASRDSNYAKTLENRSIASVSPAQTPAQMDDDLPRRYFDLDAAEKLKWQDWSASRLKLVERYLDFARTQTEMTGARKPLSVLAERLVDFNGYADRGELYQMRRTLLNAENDLDTAAVKGCASVQAGLAQH